MDEPNISETQDGETACSVSKSMLIVFFDIREGILFGFVSGCQIVNDKFYCNALRYPRRVFGGNGLICDVVMRGQLDAMHPITELS